MGLAARNFNRKQALEKEIKKLYAEINPGNQQIQATATIDLTTDIVLTSVAYGSSRNTNTFTIQVEAPAANPTDTVLIDLTGTAAAIVCTVTPNDGTNNSATPVTVTTANLVEAINTGAITGKTATITDSSSLRELQTATGGDTTDLADGGEGDADAGTFASGEDEVAPTLVSGVGFSSISRNGDGDLSVVLDDKFYKLVHAKAIHKWSTAQDLNFQIYSETVQSTKILRIIAMTAGTETDINPSARVMLKVELRNTSLDR